VGLSEGGGGTMPAVRRLAIAARDAFDRASYVALVALMTTMTAVIVVQVALRYVFNSSIDWADEAARLSFIWIVFLAVPHGVKAGVHVGLDFVDKMPPRLKVLLRGLARVVLVLFLAVVGYQAAALAVRNWGNEMVTLPLSAGLYYVALAICCLHSLTHLVFGQPRNGDTAASGP
jgi:TRAP-type C4-dicarboxylate transport system permease small subunit